MKQTIGQQIKWDFEANGFLVIKDKNGTQIYWETEDGYWRKHEYDSRGNVIYFENSDGHITDSRPKPCEGKIVEFEGEKFKIK